MFGIFASKTSTKSKSWLLESCKVLWDNWHGESKGVWEVWCLLILVKVKHKDT